MPKLSNRSLRSTKSKQSVGTASGGSKSLPDFNQSSSEHIEPSNSGFGRALSLDSLNRCVIDGTGTHNAPWGAVILIVLCVAIYLKIYSSTLFEERNACFGLYQVFYLQEKWRLILCHFVHTNPLELTFQMLSLLWKGQSLESCCGAKYFLLMILLFIPTSSCALIIIHKCLADYYDPTFITKCVCGFGTINFALKVIKMYQSADIKLQCLFGSYVCIRMKYFCWLELLVSHSISSSQNVAGNLAGVIVGALYVLGPLKIVVDIIFNLTAGFPMSFTGLNSLIGRTQPSAIMSRVYGMTSLGKVISSGSQTSENSAQPAKSKSANSSLNETAENS